MPPRFMARAAPNLVIVLLALAAAQAARAQSATVALDALISAYPERLLRQDGTYIYWRDGTRMRVSDGKPHKSFDELLRNASILDQFRLTYPRGRLTRHPPVNGDPGRFRNEAFFNKMYGDCHRSEVQRGLAQIVWLPRAWGKRVYVTRTNGIARRLQAISNEIDALPEKIKRTAYPIGGVYSCRTVADTGKPSVHSYAAAIDLNTRYGDYWYWKYKTGPIPYRNRMPQEIVDIFERHGFIWGGKWYHYDTMHFEYRPELLGLRGG